MSTILNIRDSLPPLLSESTINIVTDPDLIEFPTPDEILTPSPIPTLLMSLTNDVYHSVALLELGVKFNALILSPVDELVSMMVLLLLLDNEDSANKTSPL